ncbi:MAG: 3-phosphoshikimate 1-carboxyvinyltransferase [Crocinitomicaceae bacterium]|nr:3-phosphoshikimate 1-carboxyvinyltransferase [Crocinitomicaceae bacterium]
MDKEIRESSLKGTIAIPASKSDGQRAVLCAGLAKGGSIIINLGKSDDERIMLENVGELGAEIAATNDNGISIHGTTEIPVATIISCGESGLGLRLLTSVVSSFDGLKSINGHGSILEREHTFFGNTLPNMGVDFLSNENKLPFTLRGKMLGGNYTVDGSQSSQFLSGLLMALPLVEEDSILKVENLNSKPYVEMTLDTLKSFGIEIEHTNLEEFRIRGGQKYTATNYTIESDWSSASYWMVAAAIGHSIQLKGLNFQSRQADRAMIQALENAQCKVSVEDQVLSIDGSARKFFTFDATHCPDLFPALVVLASFCEGTSTIQGAERLVNKESNRGIALQQEFGKLGVTIDLEADEMHIHGTGKVLSGNVDSHNDHRIAMCLGIAGTKIEGGLTIGGAEAVSKSYPSFWDDLTSLISNDR